MKAYKLMTRRKDGTLGPLFINRPLRLALGTTYEAESHPTVGYKTRPGFHCCPTPHAPHLVNNGNRRWVEVEIEEYTSEERPPSQGGTWYLANKMTPLRIL